MSGFGERVRSLRESLGMTQDELAKRMGVTRPAVSAWEAGNSKPRLAKLEALADTLDTTPFYLLEGEGPREVESSPTSAMVPMRVLGVTCMGGGDIDDSEAVVEVPAGVARRHPGLFVVHGIGSCLNRRFPEDAALGVDPGMEPRSGDAVLVTDEARGSVVRVYYRGGAGTVMLSADSTEEGHEDIVIGPDDPPAQVRGVVVWWQAFEDVRR